MQSKAWFEDPCCYKRTKEGTHSMIQVSCYYCCYLFSLPNWQSISGKNLQNGRHPGPARWVVHSSATCSTGIHVCTPLRSGCSASDVSLLMDWESTWGRLKSLHLVGKPGSSWFLAADWPSSGHCGYVEYKSAEGRFSSLSLLLTSKICLSDEKELNLLKNKNVTPCGHLCEDPHEAEEASEKGWWCLCSFTTQISSTDVNLPQKEQLFSYS